MMPVTDNPAAPSSRGAESTDRSEASTSRPPLEPTEVVQLGRIDYSRAFDLQIERRDAILAGDAGNALFLLEHPPVFTLGRNAEAGDILAGSEWLEANGVQVHESDRGGQVTYHGPGQLVGYPVVSLSPHRRDVRRYVRDLQTVLVGTLMTFGIDAEGGTGERIGVWTKEESPRKIASIGIHLKRWVTTHGFALNVATKLDHFQGIVACGLNDVQMVSMEHLLGSAPSLEEVAEVVAQQFGKVFGCDMQHDELATVELEPVELEPVELETVELETVDVEIGDVETGDVETGEFATGDLGTDESPSGESKAEDLT